MIVAELMQQGLSMKEAELYVLLMRYGANRASNVAKLSRVNRTLVYALLESLVRKGFVECINRNGKKYYIANDPQIFVQKAKTQLSQAHFLLKDLHNIQLTKSQPVVRTFQGLAGIKEMTTIFLDEAETVGGEMLQMGQEKRFVLEYPELIEEFIQKRLQRKIPLKLICDPFPHYKTYLNSARDPKEMREVKVVPAKDMDVDCTTYLYGDSMAVLSLADEMQGYIFKSRNVTDLYRKMFYLLWNQLSVL